MASQALELRPFAVQGYGDARILFNTLPCFACGKPAEHPAADRDDDDEYDKTLRQAANIFAYHATSALSGCSVDTDAAGLFRDAARLTDLLVQRHQAREQARPARKARK